MASTDKLRKASGSTRPVVTSLSLPKAAGATTAELTSASGWNTATGIDVVIYRRELNVTTGLYQEVSGTRTTWTAQLTGTTLSGMVLQAGTEPASGYAADGNTVVFCGPTAQWNDDVIETLLTLFNQDQTLKPAPIQTALGLGAGALNGWNALGFAPATVTYNGNRSYDMVFTSQDLTSTLSAGMRLRTTRTVAAPTQSTSLNGTSQYYNKTSPAGMTFTDDFVAGAWVKLSSYAASAIISRYNGTSGWTLGVSATGQPFIESMNAGSGNVSNIVAYQALPLNKWVHIAVQQDMSTFTASTTTSYVMIDGVDVPASVTRIGTSPTALIQAGNLEVGSRNGGTLPFPGKIAQAFVASAKITQANIRTLYSQGLTSALITANNIISAYSFNNAITDLNTTNANNLTANGGAVATNADSPFGQQADGTISSTLDYMIVQKASFSTNTTLTVQVPEGCTIPTSGGVASMVYSSNAAPYGFPSQRGKWRITTYLITQIIGSYVASTQWASMLSGLTIPVGEWRTGYRGTLAVNTSVAGQISGFFSLATATPTTALYNQELTTRSYNPSSVQVTMHTVFAEASASLSSQTTYTLYTAFDAGGGSVTWGIRGDQGAVEIYAENAYL